MKWRPEGRKRLGLRRAAFYQSGDKVQNLKVPAHRSQCGLRGLSACCEAHKRLICRRYAAQCHRINQAVERQARLVAKGGIDIIQRD